MFEIVSESTTVKGKLFIIKVQEIELKIFFTNHSLLRIKKWEIEINKVIETLLFPEEVIIGHRHRFIAHRRYNDHLIRIIYEYDEEIPTIVTVYYPKALRYFQGGGKFEDKIFTGG